MTVGQVINFLGMTGFSSDWIEDYAVKVASLRALITAVGAKVLSAPLQWTSDAQVAFKSIKQELQSALALITPDYSEPFHLYVVNRYGGYAFSSPHAGKMYRMKKTANSILQHQARWGGTGMDSLLSGGGSPALCLQQSLGINYDIQLSFTHTPQSI